MDESKQPVPFPVRINITSDEWRDLRKLALDQGVTASELLARLVRRELERT